MPQPHSLNYTTSALLCPGIVQVLEPAHEHEYRTVSLGQYLEQQGYSQGFRDNYVLPMCAAIWSVPNKQVRSWGSRAGAGASAGAGAGQRCWTVACAVIACLAVAVLSCCHRGGAAEQHTW